MTQPTKFLHVSSEIIEALASLCSPIKTKSMIFVVYKAVIFARKVTAKSD